jgi:lipopolysaccharide/colanic/teichoic acid biosynthesis glycosyltransferase
MEMPPPELDRWYLTIKRGMDLSVAIFGLIILSPLFAVVAAIIKIDSKGPVIFCQERIGKGGKTFKIYKFRTMFNDAEKTTGPVWASENDPRVTLIGRFLRKSKIDELPQLVNLIKGEMSMVGPRPERPFFVSYFSDSVPGYVRRLDITPGITGLAQLRNGYDKCALDVIKKLRFDITYIKKMRLSLDIKLLLETFMSLLKREI